MILQVGTVNTNTHLIQHLPSISYRIHGIGTCTFSHHLEHQEILDLSLPDDQKHRTLVVERFFDVSKMVGVSNLESAMSRCWWFRTQMCPYSLSNSCWVFFLGGSFFVWDHVLPHVWCLETYRSYRVFWNLGSSKIAPYYLGVGWPAMKSRITGPHFWLLRMFITVYKPLRNWQTTPLKLQGLWHLPNKITQFH